MELIQSLSGGLVVAGSALHLEQDPYTQSVGPEKKQGRGGAGGAAQLSTGSRASKCVCVGHVPVTVFVCVCVCVAHVPVSVFVCVCVSVAHVPISVCVWPMCWSVCIWPMCQSVCGPCTGQCVCVWPMCQSVCGPCTGQCVCVCVAHVPVSVCAYVCVAHVLVSGCVCGPHVG